jgi:hypothetical protein
MTYSLSLRPRALAELAAARDGWRCGSTVASPAGTYWLRRFAGVPVAAS